MAQDIKTSDEPFRNFAYKRPDIVASPTIMQNYIPQKFEPKLDQSQFTSRTTSIICDKYFAEPSSASNLKLALKTNLGAGDSSGCTRGDLTESSYVDTSILPGNQN